MNRTLLQIISLKSNRIIFYTFLLFLLTGFKSQVSAQTGSVGIGTETPNTKAILDISSASKGLLNSKTKPGSAQFSN